MITNILLIPFLLSAADDNPPSAETQARAIFAERCLSCHGPQKQRGGLRLDRKADALKGGDSGPAILAGQSAESRLLKRIRSTDDSERMPPNGERLSEKQVQTLAQWIEAGAPWTEENSTAEAAHWSFQPVQRPKLAETGPTAIDALIQARLRSAGLSPNPQADRRTLIRRLKFDLLGLPPTPEEVAAFVQDPSPKAYEELVDRYLASPQYGERWARHWLDVVRFAESHGFETNVARPNAWPYRDWVIRSLNDDKPYDRFLQEQLAGDQLQADLGTSFLVAGPWDQVKSPDPVLTANQRADELHDIVSTTSSAFLGLTVGCARCHAHKFDPISQVDYYRLKAIFAGVQHGDRTIQRAEGPQVAQQRAELKKNLQALEKELARYEPFADPGSTRPRREPVNPKQNQERIVPVSAKFVRFLIQATNSSEPCIDELEIFTSGDSPKNVALAANGAKVTSAGDYPGASEIHQLPFVIDGQYGNSRSWISNQEGRGRLTIELAQEVVIERIVWGRDRSGRFTDRLATQYRIDVSTDGQRWQVVASSDDRLPMGSPSELEPADLSPMELEQWRKQQAEAVALREQLAQLEQEQLAYAGRFTSPEPIHRLHRGDPMSPREVIPPGGLAEIGPKLELTNTTSEAERRIALAKWITDPRNPLTARVIVNRLWQQHFGTGLVDTPSDFGRNGALPSHPELLDWLASELMQPTSSAKPWSLKHLHRLIVQSATYRQSSLANEAGLQTDAQTRLLWRFPARRLEAEPLRDSILAVSGQLDLAPGGPGFDLFEPNTNYVKVYTPKTQFGPAEFRRMIYQNKPRMELDDTFGAFDCPDGGQIAPKRNISTTALQALNLLNSPFLLQQSEALAKRLKAGTPEEQVQELFQLAFQREARDSERIAAVKLIQDHGLPALCRAILNSNEFLYID